MNPIDIRKVRSRAKALRHAESNLWTMENEGPTLRTLDHDTSYPGSHTNLFIFRSKYT